MYHWGQSNDLLGQMAKYTHVHALDLYMGIQV